MTDNTNYTYKPSGAAIGRIEVFEPKPKIVFQMGDSTEVMRLSKDGVWVNPDLKSDEAAQAVLSAIDAQIKQMVQRAVKEEREACAKLADRDSSKPYSNYGALIRARSNT